MIAWTALALMLTSAPEPVTVAVLPQLVLAEGETIGPANVLLAVERATQRRPTVRALGVGAIDVLAGARQQQLRDCGPDASCVGAILRDAGVAVGLLVVVNTRVSPPVIAVRAVVEGTVRAEHIDSRVSIEQPLADAITRTVGVVLDALDHPEWAQLSVDAAPLDAEIRVEPPGALWRTPLVALLRPGSWTLHAQAPGHRPSDQRFDVRAGEDRAMSVVLEAETPWWQSPWFWGAVGIAVAGGVALTAAAGSEGDRCVCVGHSLAPCGCQ